MMLKLLKLFFQNFGMVSLAHRWQLGLYLKFYWEQDNVMISQL
ncbi:hypothetical protein COO91_00878 [Nostoc flagelliforme CCNUN1]|uniref:Uncharacterized protein n=1 Tax=Nostoc flagelliforme CCNUN1 TaxID=2038116 RepID=A0A2K8SHX0_9NOSO|nr:hypothetical protein COO91_00878 [Nostoc flagelliforme CCNUN1]